MTFDLPSDAVVLNSSSCGKDNASGPSLVVAFGRGHTLTLTFARNATRYRVQLMRFVYNLSDAQIFPNASSKGTNQNSPIMKGRKLGWGVFKITFHQALQVVRTGFFFHTEVKTVESVTDIKADINKTYRCVSSDQIHMSNVTVTLHDATIQAYLSSNSFSKEGKTLPALSPGAVCLTHGCRSRLVSRCLRAMCVSEPLCHPRLSRRLSSLQCCPPNLFSL